MQWDFSVSILPRSFTPFLPYICEQERASGKVVVFSCQTCAESEMVKKIKSDLSGKLSFLWNEEMVEFALDFCSSLLVFRKRGGNRLHPTCIIGCWRGGFH